MKNHEIIRSNMQKTSAWQGGVTTELLIHPKDADYIRRNFAWRLSSAKVEQEESVFTLLPGYKRIILVIDGHLLLIHENDRECELAPFEQDTFSGGTKTTSFGVATDFNLMLSAGWDGFLKKLTLAQGERLTLKPDGQFLTLYLINGMLKIEDETLLPRDLFLLEGDGQTEITLKNAGDEETVLVRADIRRIVLPER